MTARAAFLSLRDTDTIKGIAILLMLVHHLFGLPSLIAPHNAYVPVLPGVPLEYWLGRFGKISVCLFLFLSGYGLAARRGLVDWRYAWGRIFAFARTYWFYLAVALAIGIIAFPHGMPGGSERFPSDLISVVRLALALGRPLVYEWWFVQTYVLLVAGAPLVLRLADNGWLLLAVSAAAFLAGSAIDVLHLNPPLVMLSNVLIWQQPFVVGLLVARHWVFERTAAAASPGSLRLLAIPALALFAAMETWLRSAMTPYLILITPLVVFSLGTSGFTRERRDPLGWLGRMSMPVWLVHPFLCYYFAQDLVFAPRFSLAVLAWLLVLTLVIVWPLERLRRAILRL
jgi:hypothetical protein